MKVLITGGAGFIGSHLAESLLKRGCRVVALDDLSTGRVENIGRLQKNRRFRLVVGSVTNLPLVREWVDQSDLIFHLAAAVGVRLIVEKPVHTIMTNIRGTEHVLAAAALKGKRVVLTSTSEVYGKNDQVPFREGDDMVFGPTTRSRWSYACSKAIDEFLALAYHRERGLPATVARLFNTIGPRQTGQYGMVVPRFVGQALKGAPLTVYGDGSQTRVFADVGDVTAGLLEMAENRRAVGEIFNLGGKGEISILALAEKIIRLTRSKSKIKLVPYDKAYQPGFEDLERRVPDLSKARKILGYRPRVSLDRTLRAIVTEMRRQR